MRKLRPVLFAALAAVAAASGALAANPHDEVANWVPGGVLNVGVVEDEKTFQYQPTETGETFVVPLRGSRFGTLGGNLVLARSPKAPPAGCPTRLEVTVDEKEAGTWNLGPPRFQPGGGEPAEALFVVPSQLTAEKPSVRITLGAEGGTYPAGERYRFFMTRDWTVIGQQFAGSLTEVDALRWEGLQYSETPPPPGVAPYLEGLQLLFDEQPEQALLLFRTCLDQVGDEPAKVDLADLARSRIRYCRYLLLAPRVPPDAKPHYWLGMYCMRSGFFAEAVKEFRAAVLADLSDADAWYMLAEATEYLKGPQAVEEFIDYFRKSTQLRSVEPNVWNAFVLISTKHAVQRTREDGTTYEEILSWTDAEAEQMRHQWLLASDMVRACSRGNLFLNNIIKVSDDPKPNVDALFPPNTVDSFIWIYPGGPAETMGGDCGPNHSGVCEMGPWGWEVYLHEWNHQLDWDLIVTENGKGAPVTHASDGCGFQPIPSMGAGHRGCDRYYISPGMYQTIQISEPPTSPFVRDWLVLGAFPCEERKGLTTAFIDETTTHPDAGEKVQGNQWDPLGSLEDFIVLDKVWPGGATRVGYAHTYIFSPVRQKVRLWLGMNDGIRAWLNGQMVYGGIYYSIVKFDEQNVPDQLSVGAVLDEGWNSLLIKVENLKQSWGFSVRLCDLRNRPLPMVHWQAARPPDLVLPDPLPPKGVLYNWDKVKDDWTVDLPRLTLQDLREHTGFPDLTISNEVLIDPGKPLSSEGPWLHQFDPHDALLNNELNWSREFIAVLRYWQRDKDGRGVPHDLVFIRPEGFDLFTHLMRLPSQQDQSAYGITDHSSRVLGYYLVEQPDNPNGRIILVLDTWLGSPLPANEEDLLDVEGVVARATGG